jgi:hypothetical protein
MSIHPTMTDDELNTILKGIKEIVDNIKQWEKDYVYDKTKNEFFHINNDESEIEKIKSWFAV